VIGGGLAGLCSAYELRRLGFRVTLIESRSRLGGRVHSIRKPFLNGQHAEAGATTISDTHDLTLHYANEFCLNLLPLTSRGQSDSYYLKDRLLTDVQRPGTAWPLKLTDEEHALGLVGMLKKYVGPGVMLCGDPDAPNWPSNQAASFDKMTLCNVMKSNGASVDAIKLLRMGYFDLWGDGADACSALMLLRDIARRGREKASFSIEGGNDRLPHAFAHHLSDSILLRAKVTRIDTCRNKAAVTVECNGETINHNADRVICTIPFSVLGSVEFLPDLPSILRNAITDLPYASISRTYIQTAHSLLPDNANSVTTDLPIMFAENATANQKGATQITESYTAGENARVFASMSNDERIESVLTNIYRFKARSADNILAATSECWDADPNNKGAFSWFKPEQLLRYRNLPSVYRNIYFAGEHMSSWPGYMQGALQSARKVVDEINKVSGQNAFP